ncbi:MAG: sigma-54 dependent transcriptional regulator [Candidatus Eisenbacteria bacterium]
MAEKDSRGFEIAVLGQDGTTRSQITRALQGAGHTVSELSSPDEALGLLGRLACDVLIADTDQVETDHVDFLKSCRRANRDAAIVLVAGQVEIEMAFEAARLGASQYVAKPVEIDRILDIVDRALDGARLKREAASVRQIIVGYRRSDTFVLGKSELMQKIAEVIEKVATSKASTVLIQGESGTGKELVAKAIHFQGSGRDKPFMEINCATVPENLLESELFGYEKGAFTDAKTGKKGLVDLAEGGSLFLDEVGEMPPNLQTKVLRLIETKRFRRIGGVKDIEVKTRIIAATNRDLRAAMRHGRFRDDLYFRLMVIPIYVPALRERKSDIPILALYFTDYFNVELAKSVRGLSRETREILVDYDWPGNVRELRNVIERAILLESTDLILPEHLPRDIMEGREPDGSGLISSRGGHVPISLKEAEHRAIMTALDWADGNKSKAARVLGISRQTLRNKLKPAELGED